MVEYTPRVAVVNELIRQALRTTRYEPDENGLPKNGPLKQAVDQARQAQLDAWEKAGIDPDLPRATPSVAASKTLGPGTVTYADARAVVEEQQQARVGLCPSARAILARHVTQPNIF